MTVLMECLAHEDSLTQAITAVDEYGWSALHIAASNGSIECVKTLSCAVTHNISVTTKETADKWYSNALKSPLISVQTKKGQTALMLAASKGWIDIVVFLMDQMHAKTNLLDANGQTALERAMLAGKAQVVDFMLGKLESKNARLKAIQAASCEGEEYDSSVQAILRKWEL